MGAGGQGATEGSGGSPGPSSRRYGAFKTEAGVRAWLKREADAVWWVENKRGGTAGFPDAIVSFRGVLMFFELKLAEGRRFKAAPAQINLVRQLRKFGHPAFIVGGVAGTRNLWAAEPEMVKRVGSSSGAGRRVVYETGAFSVESESGQFMHEIHAVVRGVKKPSSMKTRG